MRNQAWLEIRLDYFKKNIELIREHTEKRKILLMVKANAYGHGAIEITKFAFEECGISHFACATVEEALALRRSLPLSKFEIYVFSENNISDSSRWQNEILGERITPVISSLEQLRVFLENRFFENTPLILKMNTGMNRLGISREDQGEVMDLLRRYQRVEIEHLMTHLSSSSDRNQDSLTFEQVELFEEIKKDFSHSNIKILHSSISNSGAVERKIALESNDFIRLGLLAYGPSIKAHMGTVNISTLQGDALMVRSIKKGDIIGYNGLKAPRNGLLAIFPLGYGDGISPQYRGAIFKCEEYRGEVVGHINMDMTFVLFPFEAEKSLKKSHIIIWDHGVGDFLKLTKKLRLLPYHLFCQLSTRVPRKYKYN